MNTHNWPGPGHRRRSPCCEAEARRYLAQPPAPAEGLREAYERGFVDGCRIEIEAATGQPWDPPEGFAAPPDALNVERLAEALVIAVRSERAPIGGRGDGWPAYVEKGVPATVLNVDLLARAIAREYAALTPKDPT